jgi:hypothetical protein
MHCRFEAAWKSRPEKLGTQVKLRRNAIQTFRRNSYQTHFSEGTPAS